MLVILLLLATTVGPNQIVGSLCAGTCLELWQLPQLCRAGQLSPGSEVHLLNFTNADGSMYQDFVLIENNIDQDTTPCQYIDQTAAEQN